MLYYNCTSVTIDDILVEGAINTLKYNVTTDLLTLSRVHMQCHTAGNIQV